MPKPADPLTRKSLRQALKSWDNSQKLGAHPLAQLKAVQARRLAAGYGDTPAGHGVALRDMLHSALQQLKPTGSVDLADRHWRPYTILSSQYLEGRSPDYVVEQLNIARSTYDHEQAEALEALASVLREQEALSAPAPASASASTFQRPYLAPQPTPLVGREVLREQVATQLSTQRLAVLTGLPGAGKTALAAQLAHDLLDQFSDGVLWVSLGRTPDLFGALGLWAVALGLPLDEVAKLSRLEDRARLIHATLGLRSLLLVIDDAWTMEDALAFKIGGPRCAYVLTTRLPRLASEFAGDPSAIFPVPELGEPDALILLARYGLTATDAAHRPEAAALSRAVGGLPLALTIVGRYLQKEARLGQSRRLESALARLERIGETLALTEPRSPLEAQPDMPLSVLAVIAITDDALDPAARLALRALSVFPPKPNSFDEPAALAITGATAAQLDTLSD